MAVGSHPSAVKRHLFLLFVTILASGHLAVASSSTPASPEQKSAVDSVRLELPHNTRVGAKLYRNAPWLFGVELNNIIDGSHEWFSLVKDKGDHHLQLNGYIHRLAGQVLQLQLLSSKTRQLAKKLYIFISGSASPDQNESPVLKYLSAEERQTEPPVKTQPEPQSEEEMKAETKPEPNLPYMLPQFPIIPVRNKGQARPAKTDDEYLNRVKRQASPRTVFRAIESASPGSSLFDVVSTPSSRERYIFMVPAPHELEMDPVTSKVVLKLDEQLSFADKPSILFSVIVATANFRGIYRVLDCELQVQKAPSLSPVISKYTDMAWTVLYREVNTLDGAMTYRMDAKVPSGEAANLTYEFIPGMEGRAEGRFRVVPDLGLLVTKENEVFPSRKFYDMGVRAVNLNSSSPLTKYGYAFVRVFTTFQPPIFSEDYYHFYLNEETEPTTRIGQIRCMSINNMWTTVTLTSRMRPNVAAALSMDSNGTVYSRARFDYDVPSNTKMWFFTVICTENATSPSPRSSEVEVAVQLVDINDNRPFFYIDYYVKPTLTPESTPVNTEVYRISAIDSDSPVYSLLEYTLSGTNSDYFNVSRDMETNEAVITLIKPMDYESLPKGRKQYSFTISVSDGVSGPSRRATSTVVIGVQNVNDNAPLVKNFTSVLDKNAPAGTNIIQMQVWDIDGSGINYYFWTGTTTSSQYPSATNSLFAINQVTGMVSVSTTTLMDQRSTSYILPFRAIDDGTCEGCPAGTQLTSEIGYLTLNVVDYTAVAPVFTNCPRSSVNYTDDAAAGTTLMTINAVDPRSSVALIEYAILTNTLNPNPESYFVVNKTTGLITSSSKIDIEVSPLVTLKNYFWLTVRAINIINNLTAYCTFQVSFVDVNDQVPVFDSDSSITRVVAQSTPTGTVVGNVCAFDPDVPDSPKSTVQYFIVSSNPPVGRTLFSISSAQNLGTISTTASLASYPHKTKFELTIEARNPEPIEVVTKPWNQMTYTIWISTDNKLLPPIVDTNPSNFIISLNESVPPSTVVTTMTARSPIGETRTYEWHEPTRANYVPTNSAFDLHFGLRSETSTACTSNTCIVSVAGQFDYQNYNQYYVRSRVSYKDRDPDIGEIYTEVYKRVNIIDVNNRWPDFVNRQYVKTVLALENSTVGTVVTQTFVVDLDSVPAYKKVVFSLDQTVSPDYRYFSIESDTGIIRTAAAPSFFDKEGNQTQFELQVNASDSFQSSITGVIGPNAKTLRLSVSVKDINDNPPFFPRSSYAFSVREDVPIDYSVGIINATDPDVDDTLRYSIESGDPKYEFMSIVNTGEIRVAKELDFHVTSFYQLIFTVTDGRNTGKTTVNVTIINVNNQAPIFQPGSFYNVTNVTENAPAGPIWTVSAIDKDSPSVTYSLSGRWTTAPTAYFTVDPSTGVISTTRPLDREEQPVYRFNALATDGELIRYAQIFVWPVDLNDNRPTWNFTSLHGYLYDNSPVGTNFMRISVIDADITGTIVYALLPVPNNTDTSEYVTVSGTGEVVTTAALGPADKEKLPPKAPRGIFTFLVTATDGVGTPITGTASVTITDVNDNAPVFDRTTYSIDIPESTEINDNVFTAAATDVDEIDFGRLRYTLPDNPPYFNITNIPTINGGAVLLAKALDYDDASVPRSFSFRIVVIDSAPPPFSATCTLSINVIDVNDNTPVITFNPSSSVTKEEGPRSMGVLVSFTATDADPTDRVLIFSILSESDPYGNLEITGVTGTSGTINVRLALDREVWNPASTADAVHMYVLLASDQRGRTGTATLTVTITDINDTPPTLALPNTVMIMEGSAVGTFATPSGLTAVDRDKDINGGPFTYTQDMAAGNNWTGRFALQLTGSAFNIQAAKVLDRETDGKIFLLSVLITDRGGLTGTGTVTVIVGDADDNRMVSNGHKQVYVYIYEGNEDYWFNNATRISLGFASVIDADDWDRTTKTFSFLNSTSFFELTSSGEVFLKGGSPARNYTLDIEVKDSRGDTAYSQFVVTVTVLPDDAVVNSGSMVIDNMDAETFVQRLAIPSTHSLTKGTFPDYSFSAYDYLKWNLSNVLGTTFDKTHIFYVAELPRTRSIIVRFTAMGSPYYFSTRLSSYIALNREVIVRTLASYRASIRMLPVDQCRLESDGLPTCRAGCRNRKIVAGKDHVPHVFNSTALIGINITTAAGCGCTLPAKIMPTVCTYGTCLHDGNCTDIPGSHSYTCSCPAGHEGPRCEKLKAGFTTEESFLVLPSFPGACMNLHIKLHFVTLQRSASVLLFYTGVVNVNGAPSSAETDFLALELINGRPKVSINLGAGTSEGGLHASTTAPALNDGKWHRIDIFVRNRVVVLKVDRCQNASTGLDGNPAPPDLSSCQSFWTVSGSMSKLNVGSFPVFLGGRYNIRSASQYPNSLARTGFIGEIARVRFNSVLYDLYVGPRTWYSSSTSSFPPTASSCQWTDGTPKCVNGWCWGVINGVTASGACVCYSGFRLDSDGRCTIPLSIVELKTSSYLFYKVKPPLFNAYTKQGVKIDIQFRTRSTYGTLLIVTGSDPYRPEHMELGISESRLVYRHNLGDYVFRSLTLPNANVSDGAWHWVQIIRRLADVEIIMDKGEFYNYAYMLGNYTSVYNNVILGNLAAVGAVVSFEGGSTKIDPPATDLNDTCISTVRIDEAFFPVQTSENSNSAAMATLESSINVVGGCPPGVACPAGATCPATMVCLSAWRPLNPPVCGCPVNYILFNGRCYLAGLCLYSNPCVRGTCSISGGAATCTCDAGWRGEKCDEFIFTVGGASLIVILVLLGLFILLLVAFLIWYCCFAAGKSEPLLIDAPFENVVDYNEEGGGQEDKLNFDMAQLRVMVTDTTIVQEKTTNLQSSRTDFMSLLQGRLAMANAGPEPSPFDGVLDYEYEGRGAKADDLDSIVSGDDNATQNFDFLQSWGPKFERVTNIYTTLPDNADDLQSVSEVAGPSSAARSGYTVTTTTTTTKQL
ncbi:hypothetical protein BOX15_Mlig026607g4 [Macrostomum lignano]|uniref:Protocadherin Fat 4 n=2 Tax=Macrostomum lignano TaxID=282301 RepID=A0A267FTS4_9PLAT|nr:hypothetical protein BOX15_Mlig026607g4 [Macrostomum lignano]